jgi:hypothetical protein
LEKRRKIRKKKADENSKVKKRHWKVDQAA